MSIDSDWWTGSPIEFRKQEEGQAAQDPRLSSLDGKYRIRRYSTSREQETDLDHASVFIANFHAGFLLPEEFLHNVVELIGTIEEEYPLKVSRTLFNSTAHLPAQYPLLDKDPLLLTALSRVLKLQGRSLMVIGVEDGKNLDRIAGMTALADVKMRVYHAGDQALNEFGLSEEFLDSINQKRPIAITSDNVTGKDYTKVWAAMGVAKGGRAGTEELNFDIKVDAGLLSRLKSSPIVSPKP